MQTLEIILKMLLLILLPLLAILVGIVFIKWLKERTQNYNSVGNNKSGNDIQTNNNSFASKKSVLDFLEFDKIEDNMIITKNGRKYIMVMECQGINYDLMSEIEKNSVEVGFLQFLNALRHPIQLYLQTRTINLSKSLMGYKDRLNRHEQEYREAERKYVQIANDIKSTDKEIIDAKIEYNRKKNVYEYSKDVIQNTERISQNKNVLTRKYYLIISQFVSESKDEKEDLEEKREEIFQELYTKSQSLIRALAACSVQGKILNSEELVELMYVAYNRDEYDTFGMDKAIQAGYDELYSTGEDALDKRIKLLNKLIEEKAVDKINGLVQVARTEQEREIQEKEQNMNAYINAMARTVLKNNANFLGEEITEIVEEKLDEEKLKEEKRERIREKRAREGVTNVSKKEQKPRKHK